MILKLLEAYILEQGSPTSGQGLLGTCPHSRRWAWMYCAWIILKPSSPTPSVEKLSSRKPVPGAKKVRDCCSRGLVRVLSMDLWRWSTFAKYESKTITLCRWQRQVLLSLCLSTREAAQRKGSSSELAHGLALLGSLYKQGTEQACTERQALAEASLQNWPSESWVTSFPSCVAW